MSISVRVIAFIENDAYIDLVAYSHLRKIEGLPNGRILSRLIKELVFHIQPEIEDQRKKMEITHAK